LVAVDSNPTDLNSVWIFFKFPLGSTAMNPATTVQADPVNVEFKQKLTFRQELTGRKLGSFAMIGGVAVIGLVGYGLFSGVLPLTSFAQLPADAATVGAQALGPQSGAAANSVSVATAVLEVGSDRRLPRFFTGLVKPARSSDLGFKRTGRITNVSVDQGDRVALGQVLAQLDTDSVAASLLETEAQLAAAKAKLAELVAGPRVQTIQAARAQVAEQTAQVRLAETQFQRTESLKGSGAISKQEYDDARYQLAAVEGRLNVVNSQLEELEAGTRVEQIDAQKANVAQLDAAVAGLKVDIEESSLLAPYDAIVSKRMLDEGTIVPAGSIVLRLVESSQAEVWIGLPADTVSTLEIGAPYSIKIDDDQIYESTLRAVLPELDSATRTQTAIFLLPNSTGPDQTVPAFGQLARLQLSRQVDQVGFWLPTTALSRGQRGLWSVMVVDSLGQAAGQGVLQRRDVEVLQVDTEHVLVRGTIEAGHRYVVSGIHRVTPGQQVTLDGSGNAKMISP